MSMAAGEYVSVRSQADTEQADLARELQELETKADLEVAELASIYVSRGLDHALAEQVAVQLTAHDALGAHARDELGITKPLRARPVQASLASALSFAVGGLVALAPVLLVPTAYITEGTSATALIALLMLGAVAAYAGGASVSKGAARVAFWGVLAMGVTHLVGRIFGTLGAF
jgi:VIT1/CCC1 family predicted Fe2+/Mn2+ transporter